MMPQPSVGYPAQTAWDELLRTTTLRPSALNCCTFALMLRRYEATPLRSASNDSIRVMQHQRLTHSDRSELDSVPSNIIILSHCFEGPFYAGPNAQFRQRKSRCIALSSQKLKGVRQAARRIRRARVKDA